MGRIARVRISPCPECGENEWWMDVEPDAQLSEDEKVDRQARARMFEEADRLRRTHTGFGPFNRRIEEAAGPRQAPFEEPSSSQHIRCANCGHEMSLGQSGNEPDPKHDWRFS